MKAPRSSYTLLIAALLCFAAAYVSNRYAAGAEILQRSDVSWLQRQLTAAEHDARRDADTLALRLRRGRVGFEELQACAYPTFVFRGEQLLYWSDHTMWPDPDNVAQRFREKLVEMRFGSYLALRQPVGPYVILTYIPLERRYGISNRYLREGSERALFRGLSIRPITSSSRPLDLPLLRTANGTELFYLDNLQPDTVAGKYLPLALVLLGLALSVAGWLRLARRKFAEGRPLLGALAVVLPLTIFRAVLLYFGLPFSFIELPLFDPRVFAASWASPSLGDLLINAVYLFTLAWYALLLFRRYGVVRYVRRMSQPNAWLLAGSGAVLGFYCLLLLLYAFYLSCVSNSQLILDITQNTQFSGFKVLLCFAIVLHTGSFMIGFWLLAQVFDAAVRPRTRLLGAILLSVFGVIFTAVGLINDQATVGFLGLTLLFFLVIRITGLRPVSTVLPYQLYLFCFLLLGLSAASGAIALYEHFDHQLLLNKQRLAGNLLVDNDLQGEYLLATQTRNIAADPLIRTKLGSPFDNQDVVRQKIVKYYMRDYFDKYEARATLYDATGREMGAEASAPRLAQVRARLLRQASSTDLPNIYLLRSGGSFNTRRYAAFVPVRTVSGTTSTVLLELSLKKLTANSVVPELLVDQKYFQPGVGAELSYAGYENKRLVYSEGDFDYVNGFDASLFADPRLYGSGVELNGVHHLGVRGQQQRIVVVSSVRYALVEWLANFSFWFLLHVAGLLLAGVLYLLFARGPRLAVLRTNFSTKIQLFLNIGIVVPLLVVSLATASLFTDTYKRDLRRSYERRGQLAQQNLLKNTGFLADSTKHDRLTELAENVSTLTETDLNLYDAQGQLLVSSQPLIFEAGLLSNLMNPQAVVALAERGQPRILLTERAGTLSFNSLYLPLRAESASPGGGAVIGYVGIPFFDSAKELNTKLTELTTTILNIFTVMFILFLVLSFLASRYLTRPLKLITEKLRHTTLTGQNEPLGYESNDEIGLLVREYNTMLHKLEDSKRELAMQEKEAAWREMARQVAHEIKNPLTPMKLSLQFLQRALSEKRDNLEDLIGRIAQTLITQIDVLTDIATSFSNFTNLPAMRPEKLAVADVLRRCVALHQHVRLELPEEAEHLIVYADENLLVRTFNNLLINALQAVPAGRKPSVVARIEMPKPDQVRICIEDNGAGMSEEVREMVFRPNFTTKEKGSGIGLAVARRGIESAGGKIWFDTEENVGTTFCIELPLAPQ
ncbi:HAMP domain-containing sensor histidine kinase [Hymenobacter koreensis]|uniref:sensor histidine kinase n=1 Tax=Hymenobacter koreensis TaxID=1084523 RepID=UPI0031F118B9